MRFICIAVDFTVSTVVMNREAEGHGVSSDKCGTTNLWLHSQSAVPLTDRETIFSHAA